MAFVLFLQTPLVFGSTGQIEMAREALIKQEYRKAHSHLNEISLGDLDPRRMALIEFFRGVIFFEQKNYDYSIIHFDKSLKLQSRLQDVVQYYRGLAFRKLDKDELALRAFSRVGELETSDYLKRKAQFEKAQLLFEMEKWGEGGKLYSRLERKLRGAENYPDVLWSLLKINQHKKKSQQACYWARKLYRRYPTYEPVAHWGLSWEHNLVDGKNLSCQDSLGDQQDRIKRLQWMGAGEKAFAELKDFKKKNEDEFVNAMTMGEYLVNEGMVREAFDRLLPFYKDREKRKDFDYISLLAKAASRAGEYQTAVGIYLAAYKNLKGKESRQSLYRAAFLSYQNQDYDSAIRRFEILKKRYPRTHMARQTKWYIPWIYYLKGNYQKAYNLFKKSLARNGRGLPRSVSKEKVKYWMAMSMIRLGNKKVAQDILLDISHDEYIGYYSIAAVQRLREQIGDRALASIEHHQSLSLHENWLPHLNNPDYPKADSSNQTLVEKTKENYFEEWERLPYMKEYLDMKQPTTIYARVTEPEFRLHIERAKDLAMMGMLDLAKWELYSVEGRTKNKDYLKTLMFEYYRNQVFHRSAYIGTRHFAELRTHLGLHIGASLWQYVYPRAFEKEVLTSSQKFSVPPEFVWSIMKAETNFRPDALSPVGARGLMQVMTHTGRKVASLIGKKIKGPDLFEPQVGVEIGSRYLKRVLKKFKGKIPLAAAAYNGGPHRVHKWLTQFGQLEMDEFIEHIPFLETRNYVKKVTRYYTLYNLLYNKDAEASSWLANPINVYLEGTPPTRETWEVL